MRLEGELIMSEPLAGDRVDYTTHAIPRKTPDRTIETPVRHVKVIGSKAVFGLEPGDVGDLELTDGQYTSLVKAGHIEDAKDDVPNTTAVDDDKDGE